MDMISLLMLLGFALATFAAGATGARFRPGEWYKRLDKPSWRPPDRLFAPVWTLLYATIALSGWLVWREGGLSDAVLPLTVFTVQLMLNAAWSPIFFGLHRADLAFFEIILVWLSRGDHLAVLHDQPRSSSAAPAVSGMGKLRLGAQLRDLAA